MTVSAAVWYLILGALSTGAMFGARELWRWMGTPPAPGPAEPLPGPPVDRFSTGHTLESPVQIPGVTDGSLPHCPHGRAGVCGAIPGNLGSWIWFSNWSNAHFVRHGAARTLCGHSGVGRWDVPGTHWRPGSVALCIGCEKLIEALFHPRETPHDQQTKGAV